MERQKKYTFFMGKSKHGELQDIQTGGTLCNKITSTTTLDLTQPP